METNGHCPICSLPISNAILMAGSNKTEHVAHDVSGPVCKAQRAINIGCGGSPTQVSDDLPVVSGE